MKESVAELEEKGPGPRFTTVTKEGDHDSIPCLAFPDDLVLLAESEGDMQHLVDICAQARTGALLTEKKRQQFFGEGATCRLCGLEDEDLEHVFYRRNCVTGSKVELFDSTSTESEDGAPEYESSHEHRNAALVAPRQSYSVLEYRRDSTMETYLAQVGRLRLADLWQRKLHGALPAASQTSGTVNFWTSPRKATAVRHWACASRA
ncbi:hypothetical protein HPB47_025818 [Ixodes persulcatus]|uniref:Uncharacterized protein n=1 Tax=Ixodes persulcatus TaxID=34615 RepID=A0AC60Q1S3_IXOPE|nr:hypothetical protein HPB47_025818 [Ixodes persulcatus]